MKRNALVLSVLLMAGLFFLASCGQPVQSVSGTKMAKAGNVKLNPQDNTIEQQAIKDRIQMDNQPGSIKHLYVISAYSGQVIIYSTVRGKVTSSGKRLTPDKVLAFGGSTGNYFEFEIGGKNFWTDQILAEDGTHGNSIEYLYWWDSKGVYHQHYVSGGQILHISDQPLVVKGIIINMEIAQKTE